MGKSVKNNNFNTINEKNDKIKFKNFPFNRMLSLYVDFNVKKSKKNARNNKEGRNTFKADIYDDLEKKTGIACETIKKYYLGYETLSEHSDNYEIFAEIFKCDVYDILPRHLIPDNNRIKLAERICIDEESYYKLLSKRMIHLWDTSELDRTYCIILNHIIQQDDFLTIYENEIDDNLKKLFEKIKNYENYKNMPYNELLLYMQTNEQNDYQILENLKSKIQNALSKQIDEFVKMMFEKKLKKGE